MRFLYLGEILLSIPYVYKEKSLKFPKVTLRSLSSLRPVVLLQAKNTESLPEYFAFRSRKFFLSVTDSRNVFLCSRLAIWSLLGFGSSHGQQGTWFITQLVTGPYFLFPSYHFISRSRWGRPKKGASLVLEEGERAFLQWYLRNNANLFFVDFNGLGDYGCFITFKVCETLFYV